jgi:hypothetical protein
MAWVAPWVFFLWLAFVFGNSDQRIDVPAPLPVCGVTSSLSQGWLPTGENGKDGKFVSIVKGSFHTVEELDVPAVDQ